ncbi:YEATS family protein, partial [Reticulomyxa filosa]
MVRAEQHKCAMEIQDTDNNEEIETNRNGIDSDDSKVLLQSRYFLSKVCFELRRYDEAEEFLTGDKLDLNMTKLPEGTKLENNERASTMTIRAEKIYQLGIMPKTKLSIPNGSHGLYLLGDVYRWSDRPIQAKIYYQRNKSQVDRERYHHINNNNNNNNNNNKNNKNNDNNDNLQSIHLLDRDHRDVNVNANANIDIDIDTNTDFNSNGKTSGNAQQKRNGKQGRKKEKGTEKE